MVDGVSGVPLWVQYVIPRAEGEKRTLLFVNFMLYFGNHVNIGYSYHLVAKPSCGDCLYLTSSHVSSMFPWVSHC